MSGFFFLINELRTKISRKLSVNYCLQFFKPKNEKKDFIRAPCPRSPPRSTFHRFLSTLIRLSLTGSIFRTILKKHALYNSLPFSRFLKCLIKVSAITHKINPRYWKYINLTSASVSGYFAIELLV